MKPILVILGLIFLVMGVVVYRMPIQTAGVTTTVSGESGTDTQTAYSSLTLPFQVVIGSIIIGAVLFILGLIFPDKIAPKVEEGVYVETKEHVDNDGKHLIRERRERHVKS